MGISLKLKNVSFEKTIKNRKEAAGFAQRSGFELIH